MLQATGYPAEIADFYSAISAGSCCSLCILESAVVRSEMEVVLRCENDVQFDALTVAEFHNALCGLASISLLVSRAGCYYRLVFHRWLYFINNLN